MPLKPKHVVDAAGPSERAVGDIAFPQAGVVNAKGAKLEGRKGVRYRGIHDVAKFEVAGLFLQRPTGSTSAEVTRFDERVRDLRDILQGSELPLIQCEHAMRDRAQTAGASTIIAK